MTRENRQPDGIDLGTASDKTLGGDGIPLDFVKDIPATTGISDD